jgi:CRISPR-associated endonuclease Csn1
MVRVDVFRKGGKHYLVPVYVSQVMAGELPMCAIKAHKPEDEWTAIDSTYEFLFTLYPNELVELHFDERSVFGYYVKTHRGSGSLTIAPTNSRTDAEVKDYGVLRASGILKHSIDMLGQYYPVRKEVRLGLARGAGKSAGATES